MDQALKHAEAGAKASDAKTITEHAETAKSHVTITEEHLKAGTTSLGCCYRAWQAGPR